LASSAAIRSTAPGHGHVAGFRSSDPAEARARVIGPGGCRFWEPPARRRPLCLDRTARSAPGIGAGDGRLPATRGAPDAGPFLVGEVLLGPHRHLRRRGRPSLWIHPLRRTASDDVSAKLARLDSRALYIVPALLASGRSRKVGV
jgi:hypothetical protein